MICGQRALPVARFAVRREDRCGQVRTRDEGHQDLRGDREGRSGAARFATGMTNFSAVSVSEKLTTFTSTSPACFPAAITSASEIARSPFGRTIQMPPSGTIARARSCSLSSDSRRSAPQKIRSAPPEVPRGRSLAPRLATSRRKPSSLDAKNQPRSCPASLQACRGARGDSRFGQPTLRAAGPDSNPAVRACLCLAGSHRVRVAPIGARGGDGGDRFPAVFRHRGASCRRRRIPLWPLTDTRMSRARHDDFQGPLARRPWPGQRRSVSVNCSKPVGCDFRPIARYRAGARRRDGGSGSPSE